MPRWLSLVERQKRKFPPMLGKQKVVGSTPTRGLFLNLVAQYLSIRVPSIAWSSILALGASDESSNLSGPTSKNNEYYV